MPLKSYSGYVLIDGEKNVSIIFAFCNQQFNFYGVVGGTIGYIKSLIDEGLVKEI